MREMDVNAALYDLMQQQLEEPSVREFATHLHELSAKSQQQF